MAMKNYKVEYADGTATFFQFDESDPAGKAGLEALEKAAKNKTSDVKKVSQADPAPANKG